MPSFKDDMVHILIIGQSWCEFATEDETYTLLSVLYHLSHRTELSLSAQPEEPARKSHCQCQTACVPSLIMTGLMLW